MSMVGVAVGVTVAGSVAKGVLGANAAKGAANAQEAAANQAYGVQQSTMQTVQGANASSQNLGYGANAILASLFGESNPNTGSTSGYNTSGNGISQIPGSSTGAAAPANYSSFYNSPGFLFSEEQGQNAINAGASAGGNLFSTSTLNSLNKNAQGLAGQQYNNYVSQLMGMANLGQGATNTVSQAALETGANESNILTGKGAAAAGGILGQAGAETGAISSVTGALTGPAGGGTGGGAGASGGPNASGVSQNGLSALLNAIGKL